MAIRINTPIRLGTSIRMTPNAASLGANSLLTGLISYWKLDESSGNSIDSASGGNNGTTTNIIYSATGKINTAYQFDATAYVDYGNPSNLSFSAGSISYWVYPTNLIGAMIHLSKGNVADDINGWWTGTLGDSILYIELANASSFQLEAISSGALSINTWYHVVATWDGSTVKSYINNIPVLNTAQTVTPITNVYNFNIGKSSHAASSFFEGTLDEVGVWNRTLTSTEISTLYNSGAGKAYPF